MVLADQPRKRMTPKISNLVAESNSLNTAISMRVIHEIQDYSLDVP